jgi:hypothetical protein
VKITNATLAKLTNTQLADLINTVTDDVQLDAIITEMDTRAEIEARIAALVAAGSLHRDAYAEVHGLDPAELDRQERASVVKAERREGESLEQTVDRMHTELTDQRYIVAEDATRGHMLNKAGQAAEIDPRSLMVGPASRVRKFASPELRTWFYANGRITWVEFMADMLGRAAHVQRAANVDRNYGDAVAA